jgi:hypothetical protein
VKLATIRDGRPTLPVRVDRDEAIECRNTCRKERLG